MSGETKGTMNEFTPALVAYMAVAAIAWAAAHLIWGNEQPWLLAMAVILTVAAFAWLWRQERGANVFSWLIGGVVAVVIFGVMLLVDCSPSLIHLSSGCKSTLNGPGLLLTALSAAFAIAALGGLIRSSVFRLMKRRKDHL
jgi:hypothetical protein